MGKSKTPYTERAKSLDEQISILRGRNVIINDEKKAKEYLSDIGYYRLCFYSFPFEMTYPKLDNHRNHDVIHGTTIEEIVALYYYDFDIRTILNKYISRIEVSIRTTITYKLSLKYNSDPYWFINHSVVTEKFIQSFDKEVYTYIKNKPTIKRHHCKYNEKYAPAWKTIEFMTMGNLETLYDNLIMDKDKKLISNSYGEASTSAFKSYITTIRSVRNACAHGNTMYDLKLESGIKTGVACTSFKQGTNQNFNGALQVIDFMIRRISVNRANDMWNELYRATKELYSKVPSIRTMVESSTGIIIHDNGMIGE